MAVHSQTDHLASPRQMVTPSIRLENVSAGYWRDEPVLEDLCADIQGPGMFHLAGPNGVGKSTLFEVIAGYLETWAGRVEVGGQPVRAGYLVTGLNLTRSDPVFVSGVSVSDHLHLYARRYGADCSTRAEGPPRQASRGALDRHRKESLVRMPCRIPPSHLVYRRTVQWGGHRVGRHYGKDPGDPVREFAGADHITSITRMSQDRGHPRNHFPTPALGGDSR